MKYWQFWLTSEVLKGKENESINGKQTVLIPGWLWGVWDT